MIPFMLFIIVYTAAIFIWSYVFINKGNDKINQSFLLFLGIIIAWMVLNVSYLYLDDTWVGVIIKSAYFVALMNMSVLFLNFVYRFVQRKHDVLFFLAASMNVLFVLIRFLLPIDFSQADFWHLADPVLAPLMAAVFSLPMLYAVFLIVKEHRSTGNARRKKQSRFVFYGILSASVISIISEYVLPSVLQLKPKFSLMYLALFALIVFLFYAILKYKFLGIKAQYVYQILFLHSVEGIMLVDKEMHILNINDAARKIFNDFEMDEKAKITKYIDGYVFDADYNNHEVTIRVGNELRHLFVSQSPFDIGERGTEKLVHIIDATARQRALLAEKAALEEKSSIDHLTGFYNKRYVNEVFSQQAGSSGENIIVVFMDIDSFKSINDRYGHVAGDLAIQLTAQNIRQSLRSHEIAVRYGGDEFMVVLQDMKMDEALKIAERIRAKIKTIDFPQYDGNLRLSLSIGLSEGTGDLFKIIDEADKAMYQSKVNGKDRCTIYK